MKSINKVTKIITKILEVVHWLSALIFAVAAIYQAPFISLAKRLFEMGEIDTSAVSVYGFEISIANSAGEINATALRILAIGSVIIFSFTAMIFRNLFLMTKKSESATHFQSDNIRMLREIGIFSVSVPIIGLILSGLSRLILGVDNVETGVSFYGFTMGITVLCLTQFFARGAQLEKDVEGLL